MRRRAGNAEIKDSYDIDKFLGQGQFGEVRRGVRKAGGGQVAIKTIAKIDMKIL
jgi:serine/threonine protein kinase